MATKLPLSARPRDRFPGLCLRPAQQKDFPRMARMANAVFEHERDLDYFKKHHSIKMPCGREAEAAEELLKADKDWRTKHLRISRMMSGRHFLLATYVKEPPNYLLSGKRGKEEILGWAEYQAPLPQDPEQSKPVPADSSHGHENNKNANGSRLGHPVLDDIVEDLSFKHRRQGLFVPRNGLAVNLGDALASFRRAQAEHPQEWARWCDDIFPICLGTEGDPHGKRLALRALVINPTHWDNGIGTLLIDSGKEWARLHGWSIYTLASAISESTLGTLRAAGFVELGRMDVLRDTQIAMEWRDPDSTNTLKRGLLEGGEQKEGEEGGEEEEVEERVEAEGKRKRRKVKSEAGGAVASGSGSSSCSGEVGEKAPREL